MKLIEQQIVAMKNYCEHLKQLALGADVASEEDTFFLLEDIIKDYEEQIRKWQGINICVDGRLDIRYQSWFLINPEIMKKYQAPVDLFLN